MARRIRRVLVVEDDKPLSAAIGRAAKAWADEVSIANSLAVARALLTPPPDLAIVDIRLPDGDGLDFIREVGQLSPTPLVVAISGQASPEETFRICEAGAAAYISKPMSLDELNDKVQEALGKSPDLKPLIAREVGNVGIRETQSDIRRIMFDEAMARSEGSLRGAARLLGVTRQAVQYMARERSDDAPETDGAEAGLEDAGSGEATRSKLRGRSH